MDTIFLLFIFGAVFGWIIETIYRSYNAKKYVNAGLLKGPYLPIYGFCAVILYLLSISDIPLFFKLIFVVIVPSILEFIAGVIFVRFYRINLWDYSHIRFNYLGVICLGYGITWAVLASIGFYFVGKYVPHLRGFMDYNFVKYAVIIIFIIIIIDSIFTFKNRVFGRLKRILEEESKKIIIEGEKRIEDGKKIFKL